MDEEDGWTITIPLDMQCLHGILLTCSGWLTIGDDRHRERSMRVATAHHVHPVPGAGALRNPGEKWH
jgi:hypothetical protein